MTEVQPKRLPDGVTEEQLTEFKRKHGQVFAVRVEKDGKEYMGLFRKPKLSDLSAAQSLGNGIESGDLVYSSCKLGVDDFMDTDEEVHLAAVKGVQKLFRVLEATVGEVFGAEA